MKKLTAVFLVILMLLSLCACGKSATAVSSDVYNSAVSYYSGTYEAAAGEYGGFAAAQSATANRTETGSDVPETDPQKIIYSADATIETTAFDDTCAAAVKLAEGYGGWIESSSVNGSNYYSSSRGVSSNRSASYQFRVPSEKFSLLMGELSTLGNVPYSHTYTENVTAQYYDIEARLTAYQAQETRLLEMIEKAQTVSDIVTIEDRLTELRYQIESLQSSLKNWDRQVSYSLVSLSIEEVGEYTPEAAESFGSELWQALVGGLKDALSFLKGLLVFLVGALPTLLLLGLLIFVAVIIARKLLKSRKARRDKKTAAAEANKEP